MGRYSIGIALFKGMYLYPGDRKTQLMIDSVKLNLGSFVRFNSQSNFVRAAGGGQAPRQLEFPAYKYVLLVLREFKGHSQLYYDIGQIVDIQLPEGKTSYSEDAELSAAAPFSFVRVKRSAPVLAQPKPGEGEPLVCAENSTHPHGSVNIAEDLSYRTFENARVQFCSYEPIHYQQKYSESELRALEQELNSLAVNFGIFDEYQQLLKDAAPSHFPYRKTS